MNMQQATKRLSVREFVGLCGQVDAVGISATHKGPIPEKKFSVVSVVREPESINVVVDLGKGSRSNFRLKL